MQKNTAQIPNFDRLVRFFELLIEIKGSEDGNGNSNNAN